MKKLRKTTEQETVETLTCNIVGLEDSDWNQAAINALINMGEEILVLSSALESEGSTSGIVLSTKSIVEYLIRIGLRAKDTGRLCELMQRAEG